MFLGHTIRINRNLNSLYLEYKIIFLWGSISQSKNE